MSVEDRIAVIKRSREPDGYGADKRFRVDTQAALAVVQSQGIQRTSGLVAPTMLLTGHEAAVYSVAFDPKGAHLASGSFDKTIMLWDVFGEGSCNYNVLSGHRNAVMQVQWSADGAYIGSASADRTAALWDAGKGTRKRLYKGHTKVVNSVSMSRTQKNLMATGSDDCTVRLWDARERREVMTFTTLYQVTAVEMGLGDLVVFSGGIDNNIRVWDLRREAQAFAMEGHRDTITGLALSPSGTSLLANSMDRTLCEWDVRPFATERCLKTYRGATHGADRNLLGCSWSPSGEMVAAGSADRVVHIWDQPTGQELYYLPGHAGTVNDVRFHPSEPIVASCGSDKHIYLGEL
ncbi:WD40-repeat-containing domain protein [Tribonema minus]|uniref:WD40-repeat-containing domain protein n=1 Tax=Tribonema minus TaxID=303371 RepID=A0A835ZD06_9STRA|nr:WD40-repeat-containing domain protein [Tribonema minus]